jgi:hypothetical protein
VQLKKRILLAGAAMALAADATWALAQQAPPPVQATPPGTTAPGQASSNQAVSPDLSNTEAYTNFKRDRNISVRQRPHPGYEAIGLHEGAFMIWPKLSVTAEHTDNAFATTTGQVSDTIWHIAPEVDLTSNWTRNALQAYARSIINTYTETGGQNTTDYSIGALGRIDVLRTAQIDAGSDLSLITEPKTSAPAQGLSHPNQYQLLSGFLSGAREFNRLRISGRFDVKNYQFLDREGNPSFKDRDRTEIVYTGRADYAVSPDTALFVELSGNNHDYRITSDPGHVFPDFHDRTSNGAQVLVGANFEISAATRGEVGVGYVASNYKDPAFRNISGFGARAQVEWFPTQLTTFTFTGSRTIEDAAIAGASGYLSTNLGVRADHELLRNVVVSATLGYGDDQYHSIDRHDERTTAGISATYLLNRSVGVTVGYDYFKQNSRGTAGSGEFDINKIGATVTLQY